MSIINPGSRDNPAHRWFAEARLGMFIHFSYATMYGEDLGYQNHRQVPYRQYEAGIANFNPQKFRAADWVDVAESAGCRYITLTAKHIEGFCLWDTQTTGFKITRTPFGRDLVEELAAECRRRGMPLGLYINPDDWHSRFKPRVPGNWGDRPWPRDDDEPDRERHIRYIEQQLTEVLTGYGPIACIWFDCTHLPEKHIGGRRLYELIKRLQPNCLVNERAKYGDFLTAEWQINEQLDSERYLVEQCVSVVDGGWGYHRQQRHRTLPALVDLLVRTAGCGSNLLLNVGPDPEGVIPSAQVERLAALGRWVRTNASAIYGTSGVRLDGMGEGFRATRRGNNLYVFLRRDPGSERFAVPGIHTMPAEAKLLGGEALQAGTGQGGLVLDGYPARADGLPAVIHLRFDGQPLLESPPPSPQVDITVPVASAGRTVLQAKHGRPMGMGVKGWTLEIHELFPGDVAYGQSPSELPANSDQPFEDGPKLVSRLSATMNWRHAEFALAWSLVVPAAFRVRVRVLLRCPKAGAGSRYEVRCGGKSVEASVQGNRGDEVPDLRTDWWRGLCHLPFVWEEAGELELPAGRQDLVMQPTDLYCGTVFADVMAVELRPADTRQPAVSKQSQTHRRPDAGEADPGE